MKTEVGANVPELSDPWTRARISEVNREIAILHARITAHDDAFLNLLKAMAEGHKSAVDIFVGGFPEVLKNIDKKITEVVDEKIAGLQGE